MKIMKWILRLFKLGALISLISMLLVVAIQVFARYFLVSTPHWTEEAARMFFIYSVAFGTGIGIVNGDFIRLDLIEKYLSLKMLRVMDDCTDLIVIAFSLCLLSGSIEFVKLGLDELSPALEITMGFVFMS